MQKKKYTTPSVKAKGFVPGKLMIPISGQTTPEEADAKGGWTEDDIEEQGHRFNVWE